MCQDFSALCQGTSATWGGLGQLSTTAGLSAMQIAYGRGLDAAAGGQLVHLFVQVLRRPVQWQQGRAGQTRALSTPGSSLQRQVCVCLACTCMSWRAALPSGVSAGPAPVSLHVTQLLLLAFSDVSCLSLEAWASSQPGWLVR